MTLRERLMGSRWRVVLAASAVVSVIGGGFWFATQFQSPAQQQADARAPAPGPVFADVVHGSLVGEVGFAGEVGPSTETPVTILPAPDAPRSVVTGHPLQAGSVVSSGYSAPTRSAESDDTGDDGASKDSAIEAQTPEVFVPVAEIVAMPTGSAQVVRGLRIGQPVGVDGAADLVLGSADVVITVTVLATDLGDVAQGDSATVTVDGVEVEGVVGEVRALDSADAERAPGAAVTGEDAATDDASAPEVTFTVDPDSELPVTTGRARVTVTTQIVAADALIVPILAVSDRGADKNILTKQQGDGTLVEVPVTVLGTLEGEVAVEPLEADALAAGDRVRVG